MSQKYLTSEEIDVVIGMAKNGKEKLMGWIPGARCQLDPKIMDEIKEKFPFFTCFPVHQIPILQSKLLRATAVERPSVHYLEALRGDVQIALEKGDVFRGKPVPINSVAVLGDETALVSPASPWYDPRIKDLTEGEDKFFRDLVSLVVPDQDKIVPTTAPEAMRSAGIRVKHDGLAQFCDSYFQMGEGMVPSLNALSFRNQLIENYRSLDVSIREAMISSFYYMIWEMKADPSSGRIQIPKFTGVGPRYTEEELEKTPSGVGAIWRKDDYTESPKPVTLPQQLTILGAERAFRGEDSRKAGYFASATQRGMYTTKSRRQMCDIISVLHPVTEEVISLNEALLSSGEAKDLNTIDASLPDQSISSGAKDPVPRVKSRVVLIPHSDSLIPNLIEVILDSSFHGIVFIYAPSKMEEFSSKYPDLVISKLRKSDFVVSFAGYSLPAVEKKVDLQRAWDDLTSKSLEMFRSVRGFCLWRKISPNFIREHSKLSFFKFHSSHAFDCLVTNMKFDWRMISRWNDTRSRFELEKQRLKSIDPDSWAKDAFADSRLRTFAVTNDSYGTLDLGLNLYGTTPKMSKKEMNAKKRDFISVGNEYVEMEVTLKNFIPLVVNSKAKIAEIIKQPSSNVVAPSAPPVPNAPDPNDDNPMQFED